MLIRNKIKKLLIASAALVGLVSVSALGTNSVSAESFNNSSNATVSGKYAFTPTFTSKTTLSTWGAYSADWTRSNVTEIGNIGNILPNAVGYGAGGYAKTLTSNANSRDAGDKRYSGNSGVLYSNVGINPNNGKAVDLKITIDGTNDDNSFGFSYRKLSFSESQLSFAETGYNRVNLTWTLVDHGTNNVANISGVTYNMGDVDRYQFVQVLDGSYKNLNSAQVSKDSVVKRNGDGNGVRYTTGDKSGSASVEAKSLSLQFNGASNTFAYGKDYRGLTQVQIEIGGAHHTYAEWNRIYGNGGNAYNMRKGSAAAEYMNIQGAVTPPYTPDGSPFKKEIVSGNSNPYLWQSTSINPYQDEIKYKLTTGMNGKVASGVSTGALSFKDTMAKALAYTAKPVVTAYNPDGTSDDVTNDFNYTQESDNSSFKFTSKDASYISKHTGTYYVMTYSAKLKSNSAVDLPKADSNNHILLDNTATEYWDAGSISRSSTYGFTPTTSSANKTLSDTKMDKNSDNARVNLFTEGTALPDDVTKVNSIQYVLSSKLGTVSSSNKTMSGFNISDKLPRIFNKIQTSDVSVSLGNVNVTNDFNISLSGDALSNQTLTATPKDASKYYGQTVTVTVNATKDALTKTTMKPSALTIALDSYMTDANSNDLSNSGSTVVQIPNKYDLNLTNDTTIVSNEVAIKYGKVRQYVAPVMNGTDIAPRKGNSDNDSYPKTVLDGYYGTTVDAKTVVFSNMPGWTATHGSNSYDKPITMITPNHTDVVPFTKNEMDVTAGKLDLYTANSNNASKMTYMLTRKNMWQDYSMNSDADLAATNVVIKLTDDSGNVLSTESRKLSSLTGAEKSESSVKNANGSYDNFVKIDLNKTLNTSVAKYESKAQTGASSTAAVKNIHVNASVSFGAPSTSGDSIYGSRDVSGKTHPITWENVKIQTIKNGSDQIAWSPTNQALNFDNMSSIQKAHDKQGVNKVGGLYTLSAIQATSSDLTAGTTKNKMETATVKDDALDFEISAGYGFSNKVSVEYSGIDASNFTDKETTPTLTTPKAQSADMNQGGDVKIKTTDGKTTLSNVYSKNDKKSASTVDSDLDVNKLGLTRTFEFKPTYIASDGSVSYAKNGNSQIGGNKVYTGMNMTLDKNGSYQTDTVKLSDGLGANNFKIDYDKHVAVDVPLVLTAADKTHNADAELAFQPVFDGFKPSGFTPSQNSWLKK